jgi:probable addiction module antidote protein
MAKAGTSRKHERSLSAIEPVKLRTKRGLKRFSPDKYFSDSDAVAEALMECLKSGDAEGFKEILSTYLEVVNKVAFAKQAGIPERTLFRMLTPEGNPTLDNIAKVLSTLSRAS